MDNSLTGWTTCFSETTGDEPAYTRFPRLSLPRAANTCRGPFITICNIIGCYGGTSDRTPSSSSSSSSSSSAHALRQTRDSHIANPPLQRERFGVSRVSRLKLPPRRSLTRCPLTVQPPLASSSSCGVEWSLSAVRLPPVDALLFLSP
ncbi:hypothetical protein AOLI_G00179720 [Acnodon oligacanthus]